MKKHRVNHNKGQSMVEMGLLLPILLILSVVTIDLARGVYFYSVIFNAAREGTRYGIVHQGPNNTSPSDISGINTAVQKLTVGLNPAELTISVVSPIINSSLQVNVNYRFELITPIAKIVTSCGCSTINLHTSSTMRIER